MLLTSAEQPPARDSDFAYEVKWDGMRALCSVGAAGVKVWSRRGTDFSEAFPELHRLRAALGGKAALLDGEIVCMDGDGRPSFSRIRRRWVARAEHAARILASRYPATFVIFDLLQLEDRDLMSLPYSDRRARLAELRLRDKHWLVTDYSAGNGEAVLAASRSARLEGIVAKRLSSRYRPGVRSADWLKIKNYERDSFAIGGWLASPGGGVEALLVGKMDARQRLEFHGTVEFGLDSQRRRLLEMLELMPVKKASFAGWRGDGRARFVLPRLEAKVRFIGRDAGVLREAILEEITLSER